MKESGCNLIQQPPTHGSAISSDVFLSSKPAIWPDFFANMYHDIEVRKCVTTNMLQTAVIMTWLLLGQFLMPYLENCMWKTCGCHFCELKPSLISLATNLKSIHTELRNYCTAQISQMFNIIYSKEAKHFTTLQFLTNAKLSQQKEMRVVINK